MDIGLDRIAYFRRKPILSSDYTTNILRINDMHIYIAKFFLKKMAIKK